MLDAFKKKGQPDANNGGAQADELQALIAASREERAALSTMLTQIHIQTTRLAAAARSLQEFEERAARAHSRLDDVTERLSQAGVRANELEAIETRIEALGQVGKKLGPLNGLQEMARTTEERITSLNSLAEQVNQKISRIATQQPIVEQVEARLGALAAMASEVDRKLDEQSTRGAEVDALRSQIEAVGIQVTDVCARLESVTAIQTQLLPMTSQLSSLKSEIEKSHARLLTVRPDDSRLSEQERRLADMLALTRALSSETAERLQQVPGLSAEVRRSAASKGQQDQELGRVQTRHREVAVQKEAAGDQLARLEIALKQLDQRRSQLAVAEKKITAFEARLGELRQPGGKEQASRSTPRLRL